MDILDSPTASNDNAAPTPSNRSRRAIWIVFLLLLLLTISITITPNPNDDTYVYFNYARNFVAGRPFAYDPRAIPTEGFTSLVYLLLLVPFEALHIDLMFVGIVLNILALFITVGLAASLASKLFDEEVALPVFVVFSGLVILDVNILPIVARGMETLLNPLILLAAAWMIARACNPAATHSKASMQWFFVITFIAFLVRPENVAIIGGCGGLVLLQFYPKRREVIVNALLFGVVLALYHGLKYVVFHDLFATGFYRKIGDDFSGQSYILGAIIEYRLWLIAVGALVFMGIRKSRHWLRHPITLFLVLVAATTFIFVSQTIPLVGYNYRFLINDTAILMFFISMLVVVVVGSQWRPVLYGVVVVVFIRAVPISTVTLSDVNFYNRTVEQVNKHRYIEIGTYLRTHLPDHENVTMVFGDAGIFPYAFQSRFIDTNGLAEPYLAHLFRMPDGAEKAQKYTDYILSWKPDLMVLGYGDVNAEGVWTSPRNVHSPFHEPQPLAIFARYRDYGMEYVCSIKSYYDLHMGVWKDSPAHDTLVATLLDYCKQDGYILPDGFTVGLNGNTVTFPAAS